MRSSSRRFTPRLPVSRSSPPAWRGWCSGSSGDLAPETTGADDRVIPELTDRETEVLKYVATGMGYKEIAALLFLSHRTVQNHVQNIFGKLHLRNRVELARFALERGIDLADPTA